MKLIASWTVMVGEEGWIHHWIVRATCPEEAREYVEENLSAPKESDAGGFRGIEVFHGHVRAWGWKRRGYHVIQPGWPG